MRIGIPIMLATAAFVAASAEGVSRERVEAWLESQIEASRERPYLDELQGLVLRFEAVEHRILTDAMAADLRSRVEGRPDHPQRRMLEHHDRLVENGPSRSTTTIRVWAPDRWRLSQGETGSASQDDWVMNGQKSWWMTDDTLNVFDLSVRDWPMKGKSAKYPLDYELARLLDRHFLGELEALRVHGAALSRVEVEGDRWRAVASHNGKPAIEMRGRWLAGRDRGVIETLRYVSTGAESVFHDWRQHPALPRMHCAHSQLLGSDGTVIRESRLSGVERESLEAFERLLVTPKYDGNDPLRGPSRFTAVYDYSKAQPQAIVQTEDGLSRGNIHIAEEPEDSEQERGSWIRVAGWTAAAGCVVTLLWLRSKKT